MFHSLLIGISLFVPIPLLDERLATFFWKRMVADLAGDYKRQLTPEQLLALSYQSRWALSEGCLFIARRLFRELLQEVLFFLEWRKAINLASDAYYSGYLLNELFAYEGFDAAKSEQYAVALQKAKQGINMKFMQGVFKRTFQSGKGVLSSVVKWLSSITVGYVKDSWTRRKNRKAGIVSEQQMESFFQMHRSRFQEMLKDLINHLQAGIGSIPKSHFDELKTRLFEEIKQLETTP